MRKGTMYAFALLGAMVFAVVLWNEPVKGRKSEVVATKDAVVLRPAAVSPKKSARKALTEVEFDRLLASTPWPKTLHRAVKKIAFCESSWIPNAKGPTGDYGLMQVRFRNHPEKVAAPRDLHDPVTNLSVAYTVFREAERGRFKSGFAPWYMSNKCHGLVPKKTALQIKNFRRAKQLVAQAS